jgi:Arabinose-binding domain of AraC transcription regulator, N-term
MMRVAPAIALAKYFGAHKLDFNQIANACAFPTESLDEPMRCVPMRTVNQLFLESTRAVGEGSFPIKLAEESVVGNTGLLGYLAMAAPLGAGVP